MRHSRVRWQVLAVLLLGINVAGVAVALRLRSTILFQLSSQYGAHGYVMQGLYDGRQFLYVRDLRTGVVSGPTVARPATLAGLTRAWTPVFASLGISVPVVVIAWFTRKRRAVDAIREARPTMLQMMVLIGAVAIWLWLARFSGLLIAGGTTVLCLLLYSGHRRGSLAREIRSEGGAVTGLSRAGFLGYSIAVLLALAWVVTIVVWDAYRP
jgi:hypothetical protein